MSRWNLLLALAHMLDVTPLHSGVALAHMLDATLVCFVVGGGGGVRACMHLAHMLDVTPLSSVLALAHMLDVTPLRYIAFRCCTRTHARCYATVFHCWGGARVQERALHLHRCSMFRHWVPAFHSHTLLGDMGDGGCPYFLAILIILLMQCNTCFP